MLELGYTEAISNYMQMESVKDILKEMQETQRKE